MRQALFHSDHYFGAHQVQRCRPVVTFCGLHDVKIQLLTTVHRASPLDEIENRAPMGYRRAKVLAQNGQICGNSNQPKLAVSFSWKLD